MSCKKNKSSKRATKGNGSYAATLRLVWAIIAYLYFISTPKVIIAIIFNMVPTLLKSLEDYEEKGMLYRICTVLNAVMLFVLVAMAFKVLPMWEPIKYYAFFGILGEAFKLVEKQ